MVVAKKRFDLKKIKDRHNGLDCLKVVTHKSTNPPNRA